LVMWDDAIAKELHGARDREAYGRHLRLMREWGAAVLAESAMSEAQLCRALGCPGRPLALVLDNYAYLRITARRPVTSHSKAAP